MLWIKWKRKACAPCAILNWKLSLTVIDVGWLVRWQSM
jgi:hypothetical protein